MILFRDAESIQLHARRRAEALRAAGSLSERDAGRLAAYDEIAEGVVDEPAGAFFAAGEGRA